MPGLSRIHAGPATSYVRPCRNCPRPLFSAGRRLPFSRQDADLLHVVQGFSTRLEMCKNNGPVVFVQRTDIHEGICLAWGLLLDSRRSIDFAEEAINGFRVGRKVTPLTFGVHTEMTDVRYSSSGHRLVYVGGEQLESTSNAWIVRMASNQTVLTLCPHM